MMWLQLFAVPTHFDVDVRENLDNRFPNRGIGRGGPVSWPLRSLDLTPLDFFPMGYIKSLVYETPAKTEEELSLMSCLSMSHLDEPDMILSGVAPKISHVGIMPDDAAGGRVFSGISHFPHTCIPELLHTHFTSPSLAVKNWMLRAAQISPRLVWYVRWQGLGLVARLVLADMLDYRLTALSLQSCDHDILKCPVGSQYIAIFVAKLKMPSEMVRDRTAEPRIARLIDLLAIVTQAGTRVYKTASLWIMTMSIVPQLTIHLIIAALQILLLLNSWFNDFCFANMVGPPPTVGLASTALIICTAGWCRQFVPCLGQLHSTVGYIDSSRQLGRGDDLVGGAGHCMELKMNWFVGHWIMRKKPMLHAATIADLGVGVQISLFCDETVFNIAIVTFVGHNGVVVTIRPLGDD
ncbi:hypothetical protein PR048_012025 [Dryococelus australis]|uniref:Uncharacterized protein n=1 Tax=Dryococelus australis TaxID=614101 RepID=A0ABQ9HNR4_9NEOP|nr:hypothetical protein PR048_012025 [Dryococelus australis]